MRHYLPRIFCPLICFIIGIALIVSHHPQQNSENRSEIERETKLEAKYAFEAMQWYNDQRAYPSGRIPEDWKQNALKHIQQHNLQKSSLSSQVIWSEVGPSTTGGRVRSIAVDPANSNIIYCGSVSGGVWKSSNAGSTWFATNDFTSNMVISSIAIDPTNSNIIYAGTGEGFFNIDALRGAGILKSTDGGANWTLLTNFSTPNPTYGYNYITRILIRPGSPSTLYAAMIGGIWKSTDSGASWSKLTVPSSSSFCVDLVENPTTPDILYAAFGLFTKDGIYKSTNGGTGWSKLTTGLPTSGYGRVSLGLAPGNPQIVYAVFDDSATHDTYNIYKTTNSGSNWSQITKPSDVSSGGFHLGGQGWYNNAIAVHPTDPNTVIIGGINLFKTTNGGTVWSMISDGINSLAPFVHVDQHAIVFDPGNPAIIYFGNDGGVYKSQTGGSSFSAINNQLAITQLYSGAIHPSSEIYYAGTQDNGTLKSDTLPTWKSVFSGDGGVTAVDYTTPTTAYTEYVYLDIQKSTDSGLSWSRRLNGIPVSGMSQSNGTSDRCQFIAPYVMDPSNSQVLVAGTFKVYRTVNGGGIWTSISSDLTGDGDGTGQVGSSKSSISAIAIAKTSSASMYVGTSGSSTIAAKVQVTTNTGSTWIDRSAGLPNRHVTSIAIDTANALRAFVTFSGYGTGHVFRTTSRGSTWTDVSGNLPDLPVNVILIDPSNPNHLFIGTDLGVFESTAGGTTWAQQNSGLANVSVQDLDIRSDGFLFAATHGRGMFKTTLSVAVQEEHGTTPSDFSLNQNYPNPFNPSTKISFTIARRAFVRLTVFDVLGREVATLVDQELQPGSFTSAFDGTGLASGMYFYTLNTEEYTSTKKMLLVK